MRGFARSDWGSDMGGSAARVLIVGGSPAPSAAETVLRAAQGCDAVVAVDRGFDALCAAGLACDLFCGDADSVSPAGALLVADAERDPAAPGSFPVVRYNPHKDDTDLGLALREVSSRWPGAAARVTCTSGGQPDHALAVLGILAKWPMSVEVVEDAYEQRILHAGDCWRLAGHLAERFSFIPLTPAAEVSECGMRWTLDRAQVPLLSDLGVSNVIDAEDAVITCHAGTISAWSFKGRFAGA